MSLGTAYIKRSVSTEVKTRKWFDEQIHALFGKIKRLYPHQKRLFSQAKIIHALSFTFESFHDERFFKELQLSKAQMQLGKIKAKSQELNRALALVCEASFRALGIRPYVVQIMGALAIYENFIIQMSTGEGKTITAALAGVLKGWQGRGCHVITSNDYLATRDAAKMQPLYERCLLRVGALKQGLQPHERQKVYQNSVIYSTSNELLADFLRDQLDSEDALCYDSFLLNQLQCNYSNAQVSRGLESVIIDEADSVLADDAITPLIISIPRENAPLKKAIITAHQLAKELTSPSDYTTNSKHKEIYFTPKGKEHIQTIAQELPSIWRSYNRVEYLIRQALVAQEFYTQGVDYVIREDKIVIIDQSTGRLKPDTSWGSGMHQAVEAKEGLELTDPVETHIKMSFQRFFRLYKNISGMSGTLHYLQGELWSIYGLQTIQIPKRIPNQYSIYPPKIFKTQEHKFKAILEHIQAMHNQKRPILIGTTTLNDSKELSYQLAQLNIPHQLLHALYHEEEAAIIAKAGEVGRVTIATNMAGRGTDIALSQEAIALGGLHVVSTQKNDSKRIDMQLFGRSARQGQPGSVQEILSLEDTLLTKTLSLKILSFLEKWQDKKWGKSIALLTYKIIQRLKDSKASSIRKKMLHNDFSMSRNLSFSDRK
jgi:preprotein translocase subunit SecA